MHIKTTSVYVVWRTHLLLILRSRHDENKPLWWEAPAGHVDIACSVGDSILARTEALRELREETGIVATPSDLQFLPTYSTPTHSSYILHVSSGLPPKVKLSFEHEAFKWANICKAHICTPLREEVSKFVKDICNV